MSENYAMPAAPMPSGPVRESIGRGTLAALLTVPVGVAAWVVLWGFGFIASLVGAGVAFLALRLYVLGAGRISRPGAVVVLLTTVVTLALAFFGGIVLDGAMGFGAASGLGAWGAFTHPDFWPTFAEVLPAALPDYLPDFAWALGFGALGSFTTLRTAFAAAATDEPVVPRPPTGEVPPVADPQVAPGQP